MLRFVAAAIVRTDVAPAAAVPLGRFLVAWHKVHGPMIWVVARSWRFERRNSSCWAATFGLSQAASVVGLLLIVSNCLPQRFDVQLGGAHA